jgi:hypothetical protein
MIRPGQGDCQRSTDVYAGQNDPIKKGNRRYGSPAFLDPSTVSTGIRCQAAHLHKARPPCLYDLLVLSVTGIRNL